MVQSKIQAHHTAHASDQLIIYPVSPGQMPSSKRSHLLHCNPTSHRRGFVTLNCFLATREKEKKINISNHKDPSSGAGQTAAEHGRIPTPRDLFLFISRSIDVPPRHSSATFHHHPRSLTRPRTLNKVTESAVQKRQGGNARCRRRFMVLDCLVSG